MTRWGRWGAFAAGWTLLAVFFASRDTLLDLRRNRPFNLGPELRLSLVHWYIWGGLSLFIVRLARRFPLERGRWPRSLAVHVGAALLCTSAHAAVFAAFQRLMIRPAAQLPYDEVFVLRLQNTFHLGMLTYGAILATAAAVQFYGAYRRRELLTSRLEAQLSQAQLQALKARLHPHFLFNTLNAITSLIRTDPEHAEEALVELSELLRQALETDRAQEVSLRRELSFTRRYLALEQLRFEGGLAVEFDVPEALLDARVPNLSLQPLVENAVRHGVARNEGGGCVSIRAAADGEALVLRVRDDGPGLPDGGLREGIGLSATRARLERLYGQRARLALATRPEGGAEATLTLPWRQA